MLRKAVRKLNKEEVKEAGDYCIFDLHEGSPGTGIKFVCPHAGCGDISHLPLTPRSPNAWTWHEDDETLSPSIKRLDPDRCEHHFSLIEGEWIP